MFNLTNYGEGTNHIWQLTVSNIPRKTAPAPTHILMKSSPNNNNRVAIIIVIYLGDASHRGCAEFWFISDGRNAIVAADSTCCWRTASGTGPC